MTELYDEEVYHDEFTTAPLRVPSPTPDVLTEGILADDGNVTALIGGVTGALLLALICFIGVLLWCLSRHKGSYVTNEDDDDDDDAENDDEESVASDTALRSKQLLKSQEED